MIRNGDLRAFWSLPSKRRDPTPTILHDNITLSASDSSATEAGALKQKTSSSKRKLNNATDEPIKRRKSEDEDEDYLEPFPTRCSTRNGSNGTASQSQRVARPVRRPAEAVRRSETISSLSSPPDWLVSDNEDTIVVPPPSRISQPFRPTTTTTTSPNASFGPPHSSQQSVVSLSQRVYRDGKELVTNSSSEAEELAPISEEDVWISTKEEQTDSDDDIDDIERMIADRAKQNAAVKTGTPEDDEADNIGLRAVGRSKPRLGKAKHASPAVTKSANKIKHNLIALAKAARREEALEARLKALEDEDKKGDEAISGIRGSFVEDQTSIKDAATMLVDEDDPDSRLKLALERVDALEYQVKSHFFDSVLEVDPTRLPLPKAAQGWVPWMEILRDPAIRAHAVAFAADICQQRPLPAEIQEWALGELLFEDRDDVAHSYVNLLTQCSRHEATSSLLDLPMLRDSMTRLGARDDIIDDSYDPDEDMINPDELRRPVKVGRKGLSNFLQLLFNISAKLNPNAREVAVYYIALMLIDYDVSQNMALVTRLRDTLCALVDLVVRTELDTFLARVVDRLVKRLTHPVLIAQLTATIPASSSAASALLRRRLALTHLLPSQTMTKLDTQSLSAWTAIEALLKTPHFIVTDRTDYLSLGARVSILDAAIGPGFSDLTFLHMIDDQAPTPFTAKEGNSNKGSFFAPRMTAAPPASDEEAAFNAAVDRVVTILRAGVAGRIRDAGASHMRRTECKGAVEALIIRLEGSVRSRGKGRKPVFATVRMR